MDWLSPSILILILPAVAFLLWVDRRSRHPMSARRRRLLLFVRALMVLLVLLALGSPARMISSNQQSVVFVLDHSRSEGEAGIDEVYRSAEAIYTNWGNEVSVGLVAAGSEPRLIQSPKRRLAGSGVTPSPALIEELGSETDYESAVRLASGVFPSGAARHIVLIGDGVETVGSLMKVAKEAAISGIKIHAMGVAGEIQPDVRVSRLLSSQSRLNEGATLKLEATIESSLSGEGRLRLFENGVEVDSRDVDIVAGEALTVSFQRSPEKRNIYNYRVVIEGFEGRDAIPENNEALSIVDVRGKALFLYVEGEEGESRYLTEAMSREGIRLEIRSPEGLPDSAQKLAGFDGVVLSDVAAHRIGEARMRAIRDYVELLGGGLVMVGGMNSFGVGGYYRTPIEEVLPVKLKAEDQEEDQTSALALVMDRSGSMAGQKIEICKSAAIATAELLTSDDWMGVYAFDSQVHEIVPMNKVTSTSAIGNQIALLGSGGGTNIYPGMAMAREKLGEVNAKIRHMIVLTDGQTSGQGYQTLASQCYAEGITISTVAVGSGAQIGLLQSIAAAGGGQSYVTMDPTAITRIFTQDTMTHTGRMIREEAFEPRLAESHPMLQEWNEGTAPPLLGYVKTNRKTTAQVPLVTDNDDPLLAHWRYGLGKVTAFTSDCKSRWAALWIDGWSGYGKFWSQVLRETARPPQGLNMDLQLAEENGDVMISVDLSKDAGSRLDGGEVMADIFYLSSNSLGSGMEQIDQADLEQKGPGRYETDFRPGEPGVYLVRARSGSNLVSAGYVHNPSGEVATGQINDKLLREASDLTGGHYMQALDDPLSLSGSVVARYVELWPWILIAFLGCCLVDIAVRRWENVMGVSDQLSSWIKGARS